MSNFIKQPVYLYDEPAKYTRFDGGINNDPANENLKTNELRDAINWDYKKDGNLKRRLGGKKFKDLRFNDTNQNEHRNIIQGTFNYVGKYNKYFVVIRDGVIYYSTLGESDIFNLIEVPIDVDLSKEMYSPYNLIADLDVYDEANLITVGEPWYGIAYTNVAHPNFLLNHDGFVLISDRDIAEDEDIDGQSNPYSGIYRPNQPKLILQNYRTVQGAVFDNELYVATGTKFIKVYESVLNGEIVLKAEIINPYQTNGFDYTNIGLNYLSPFPSQLLTDTYELAVSRINGILCEGHTIFTGSQDAVVLKAIMDYVEGTGPEDYWFKWEYKVNNDDWKTLTLLSTGKGLNVVQVDFASLETPDLAGDDVVQVRCTYSNDNFKTETVEDTGNPGEYITKKVTTDSDWTIDKAFAEFGQFTISLTVIAGDIDAYRPTPSEYFKQIHNCNKLFTDGRVMVLYGSEDKKGNWFKTIVNNFNYVTARNSLNFQTTKNERIVACLALEGNIIVFADNDQLGGSIHKVYGNGDDFDNKDGYFSPFKKQIVNTSVSCDHPNSVKFVKNYIIFKYRNDIYMIDSRELNAERLNVQKVSHQISHFNPSVKMPTIPYEENYEYKLFSEITEDFYSIIFPETGERWKMYFNMGRQYEGSNAIYFPWLRDQSDTLKIDSVTNINNISTFVLDDKLIQFTDDRYNDLDEKFDSYVAFKGYDLYNPNLVKFVNGLVLNYYRGATDHLSLDVRVYNEANYIMIGEEFESFYDPDTHSIIYDNPDTYYYSNIDKLDSRSLILDETTLENSLLGKNLVDSKLLRPDLKFPCLFTFMELIVDSSEDFSLSSLTFDYTTTDMPAKNLPNVYNSIVRKE